MFCGAVASVSSFVIKAPSALSPWRFGFEKQKWSRRGS
jgi:hypothetical protein